MSISFFGWLRATQSDMALYWYSFVRPNILKRLPQYFNGILGRLAHSTLVSLPLQSSPANTIMPMNYNLLRGYARGRGQEQLENPAAALEYYGLVSTVRYTRSALTAGQLRAISLELDSTAGDVMRWQYGAAEALNYVCVLHGGSEEVARVVVASRCVLVTVCGCRCRRWEGADGVDVVVVVQ